MSNPSRLNSRRNFVKLAGAVAAGALGGGRIVSASAAAAQEMRRRPIPRGEEALPVVGLGTYRTFDVGTDEAQRAPLREVLRRFVAHGGALVDSSPMYGRAEALLGELASDLEVGEQLFHATKVWTRGRAAGERQMRDSFSRMRVPRMDLMQIHNLLDLDEHYETLRQWKDQGLIRHIGITHYHAGAYSQLERLLQRERFDFVQFNYSVAEREAEKRLLPMAHDTGTAVLINRPFAQAALFRRVRGEPLPAWCAQFDCASWAQFFLKYVIAHPAVTCAIPATSNPVHLVDNMGAGVGRLPDEEQRRRMAALIDSL